MSITRLVKVAFAALTIFCVLRANAQDHLLPANKGELVRHTHYTLSYIEAHEQPEWVAYSLRPEMLKRIYKRKDNFRPDPLVLTKSATYEDYGTSPDYDAGHLLPCRQMQFDCTAMSETFFMSNMSPQHKDLNRIKWASLERLERNMTWSENGLFVVTGPVLTHTQGSIGSTNRVSIPMYFYKVFLAGQGSAMKAIAFILPNQRTNLPLEDYVVSVDSLEKLSGIDFFPALDDALENRIESVVDRTKWNFSNPNSNFGYTLPEQPCQETSGSIATAITSSLININSANADELMVLPGIGLALAQAIIAARPFTSVQDLTRVKGIGPAKLRKLQDRVSVQ